MRRGGGKSKGGAYEHIIIHKLAAAFKPLGIQEDDCYRTKNSGATKSQLGDVQFSPRFAKLFPVLVECKHYKSIRYSLGKTLSGQAKTSKPKVWWRQVIREQKERKDKMGILVFRQNNCPDVVALKQEHYNTLISLVHPYAAYTWCMFTMWKKETIIMLPFDEFLRDVVSNITRKRNKVLKGKK